MTLPTAVQAYVDWSIANLCAPPRVSSVRRSARVGAATLP
jgi:hypothetical protein